jgi:hypothetical protein
MIGLHVYRLGVGPPSHKRPNQPRKQHMGLLTYKHTLTPLPAIETLATADVETGPKLRRGQPLSEDVGELGSHQDVEDTNVFDGNTLADEVEINLHMLGALMLNRVGGEGDRADAIAVDQSGPQ